MQYARNHRLEKAMRYCESCGVGVGLMTRKEFAQRYIHHDEKCPVCGRSVVIKDEEKKKDS